MVELRPPRLLLTLSTLLLLLAGSGVRAQDPGEAARVLREQGIGQGTTQAEILERIRASGLSRAEARARLQQMGYDPSMVDRYYDALEGRADLPSGAPPSDFARALDRIERAPQVQLADTTDAPAEETRPRTDSIAIGGERLPLFGRDLFTSVTSEFQPILYGPVDVGYRLGPGDEVLVVLTGGVEAAYDLEVNRQGQIVVPDVGQVPVNGLTIGRLEEVLRQSFGRVYAGVRGQDPSIRLQVSLGRLRTNQVYVMGEVDRPGAYQVSGVATVFNALYRAGGPSLSGSFRTVRVWRRGEVVGTIDLYDYLVAGDGGDDVRLENGDRIHVPLAGPRAAVRGEVPREAVYELREGETLVDLLRYAGGFRPEALVRRVQVDRILPPDQRSAGTDRVLLDVNVLAMLSGERAPVAMQDGDVVEVFGVSQERRNRVSVRGDVRRPGTYEWSPDLTLSDLLARAEGLTETAYTARAHVFRLNEATGERRLIRAPLERGPDGRPAEDLALADRDSVVIFSRSELRTPQTVEINGYVKEPGTYQLAAGMTIKDLILAAGGFVNGAHTLDAEVARRVDETARTDSTARVLRVPLAPAGYGRGENGGERALPAWYPEADDFELREDDRVFIRKAPAYDELSVVSVTGEVAFPGEYVLSRRQERFTDLVARAGGFTGEAFVPGVRLVRDGNLVAMDAREALENPSGSSNLVIEAGDSLHVSGYDPTVLVQGAVNFEARVLYRPGASLAYYIAQAGGYGDHAARDRVSVTQQNGERTTVRNFLTMRMPPRVTPGSVVHVPVLPPAERAGLNYGQLISTAVSLGSVTATLLLAINQLLN